MRLHLFLVLSVLCVLPSAAHAQVPAMAPYVVTDRVVFVAPDNAPSLPEAQALEYRLGIDSATPVPLANVTCTVTISTVIECAAPLTPSLVTTLNVVGKRDLTITAVHPTGGAGPASVPFVSRTPPSAPAIKGLQR